MRDELYDREYQAGRDALHDGIDRMVLAIGRLFAAAGRFIRTNGQAIHAFEFDAPWQVSAPAKLTKRTRSAVRPRRPANVKRAKAA